MPLGRAGPLFTVTDRLQPIRWHAEAGEVITYGAGAAIAQGEVCTGLCRCGRLFARRDALAGVRAGSLQEGSACHAPCRKSGSTKRQNGVRPIGVGCGATRWRSVLFGARYSTPKSRA